MKDVRRPVAPVPVVVITGYLGSGKTTLLRRLIEGTDRRLALLINEFGELAIDSRVVEGKNIRITELEGGCVCCSLIGEFEKAVAEVIETVRPDEIMVETTGIAEPDALIENLEGIPGVMLEAVVTIVDADATARFPSIGYTGRIQIASADLLLLNKTDLVTPAQRDQVRKAVREINPSAPIFETVRCGIDPALILGTSERSPLPLGERVRVRGHEITFESFHVTVPGTLRRDCFEKAMAGLPGCVYRAKGFVRLEDGEYLFNHVAGRQELESLEKPAPSPSPLPLTGGEDTGEGVQQSRLVFIGEGIRVLEPGIRAALERCRAEE